MAGCGRPQSSGLSLMAAFPHETDQSSSTLTPEQALFSQSRCTSAKAAGVFTSSKAIIEINDPPCRGPAFGLCVMAVMVAQQPATGSDAFTRSEFSWAVSAATN